MATSFFITGCTRGIGLEFCRQLTARGDDVTATARDPVNAGELTSLPLRIVGLDVADRFSLEALADSTSEEPIDVLINNAGVSSSSAKLADLDQAELLRVFTINSIAPMLVAKALLPRLRIGSRKLIVNISSQLASIANNSGGSSYGYRASKTALNQFNRSLSNELSPQGFTCVVVHPGWVQTDMGGANATLTPTQSVKNLIALIDRLTPEDSGKFFNFDGKSLPW